ncbi:MAG: amidohydrolase family protein [Saprospiraceae bacterium]|nr:amidohydrolase family protein [Saprospiraceae bacterium]
MKKALLPFLFFALILPTVYAQKNYELTNGSWYNGKDFTPGTWYVTNGLLSKKAPAKVDSVVDLLNRYVIPPMGDVFCSNVADNPSAANMVKIYTDEGSFYLQILSNTQEGRAKTQTLLNKPGAPDAVFANGGITCTLGFPFVKYEAPAQGFRNPEAIAQNYESLRASSKMLGDGYWFIDSKQTLDKNWEKIMTQKPGVISIYLLDSQRSGGKENRGLTPDVAKAVVKKAHKAKLPVWAHVETVEDVRLGLKLGVDGFANLPGHNWDGTGDVKQYELTDADLQLLAKKKTAVATLFSHAQSATPRPAVQNFHTNTLKRLFSNKVNVVLGSDDPQRGGRAELNYWHLLGGLDEASVLKTLCENTPRAIFPKRKIGKIEEGYEASFLVLNDNPLTNILKVRASAFKMKNGQWVK